MLRIRYLAAHAQIMSLSRMRCLYVYIHCACAAVRMCVVEKIKNDQGAPGGSYTMVPTSSTGNSASFVRNAFKFVTRGLLRSLMTNMAFNNDQCAPGGSYALVPTSSTGISSNFVINAPQIRYSGVFEVGDHEYDNKKLPGCTWWKLRLGADVVYGNFVQFR